MSNSTQEANLSNTRATNDKALNVNANVAIGNENTFNCCIFLKRRPKPSLSSPKSQLSALNELNIEETEVGIDDENLE